MELLFQFIASAVSLLGIYTAYLFFLHRPHYGEKLARTAAAGMVRQFWFSGWGFDRLYDTLFVTPFVWIARVNKDDVADLLSAGMVGLNRGLHAALIRTQTGNVRWYAAGIAAGAVVILGIVVFTK